MVQCHRVPIVPHADPASKTLLAQRNGGGFSPAGGLPRCWISLSQVTPCLKERLLCG